MYCMNCGRELPDEAKFCLYCGTAVTPIQYADQPETPSENAPQEAAVESPAEQAEPVVPGTIRIEPAAERPETGKRKIPKWVPFAGGALIIAIIVTLLLVFPRERNEDASAAETPLIAAAVAEPTAESESGSIDYSELDLPALSEGESLYVGEMSFEQTDRALLAFILSADGSEIHDLTVRLENLQADLPDAVSISGLTVTETYKTSFDRYEDPIWFGSSMLTELYFSGNSAFVVLDYVYTYTGLNGVSCTEIPLGAVNVELSCVEGTPSVMASSSDATEPVSGPSETASVQFEDTTYVVSIGEFGTDEDGNQTFQVDSTGIGAVLSFRDGSIVIPVHMKCLCGDQYIYSLNVTITHDALVFAFVPDIEPDLLILYPDGADDDPGQWAVYSIEQGGFLSDY